MGKSPKDFSKRALNALMRYDWPGNVREIENLIERLSTVVKKPVIQLRDIFSPTRGTEKIKNMKLKDAVNEFEKRYVSEILQSVNGNRKKAAEILGIHRNTLLGKLNEEL